MIFCDTREGSMVFTARFHDSQGTFFEFCKNEELQSHDLPLEKDEQGNYLYYSYGDYIKLKYWSEFPNEEDLIKQVEGE